MFAQSGGQADLSNIEPTTQSLPPTFDRITREDIRKNIEFLPLKKALGPDMIPNELIKILKNTIDYSLENFFNSFLKLGHFPKSLKTATTVIIQNAKKADYVDPSAYQPKALPNTIRKLFE
ncbi:hypothetical protein O181_001616 [Austropuccinia psidii MF-1]|uniref:Reverse transcriptase domain-containing protein n=1 Tax=Austropuccinia psidii MF-1 TaxID=1389203 RepID=A0A9Q3BBC1_9BASI|nr:hypothetical protein [Austropuccinia psidii MF-1]